MIVDRNKIILENEELIDNFSFVDDNKSEQLSMLQKYL